MVSDLLFGPIPDPFVVSLLLHVVRVYVEHQAHYRCRFGVGFIVWKLVQYLQNGSRRNAKQEFISHASPKQVDIVSVKRQRAGAA